MCFYKTPSQNIGLARCILLAAVGLLLGLMSACYTPQENLETTAVREELREERSFLHGVWEADTPEVQRFMRTVVQKVPEAVIYSLWFWPSNAFDGYELGYDLEAIVIVPPEPNGESVLYLHGYAGNLRGLAHVMAHHLQQGYTVAGLSLPGHGLSGGPRGDIGSFQEYAWVVEDFLQQSSPYIPPVRYAVGHSTGASALIIHEQIFGWDFRGVVFFAPLIRSTRWHLSTIGRGISRPFIRALRTEWSDPYAVEVFPMSWFDQLRAWNRELRFYTPSNQSLLIFQGKQDDVTSWSYNMQALKRLFPNSQAVLYPQGDHVNILMREPALSDVLERMDAFMHSE